MTQLASEDFNRADNADLGANWDPIGFWGFAMAIVSNAAKWGGGSGTSDAGENYTAAADIADGYVECTLATTEAGGLGEGYGVTWRFAPSSGNGYRLVGSGSGWELRKWAAGVGSLVANDSGTTFAAGDVMHFEMSGGAWTVKRNGNTVTNGTGTDGSPVATGKPGVAYSSTDLTANGIDAWAYGDLGDNLQHVLPVSDISAGQWTPSAGGSLFGVLDEASPGSDTDYIVTTQVSVCEVKFNTVVSPGAGNVVIDYRHASGHGGNIVYALMEGNVQRATWNHTAVAANFVAANYTLTSNERASVSNWADLRLRITAQ